MVRLVLTGFMGTGKTEVGRRIAEALGCPFVDTDALVEAAAGRRVADIFAAEGEPHFRRLERQAVVDACAVPDAVVATGGGTLVDVENRRRLTAAGPVVCLTASAEEIDRRVEPSGARPLLVAANGERVARIRALLAERAAVYALAGHTVDTSGLDVEQVVARVRELLGER